ncbi:phosphoribosylformylglycinamidine cyclo-ligase [Salinisphaera sp. P385]|uniref:Phosphoribosylformylglycinamidine cyclo-ligase n=1 Tax=Spectribacter acetivorans TaxID=3075603 RepID=A0ABU3BA91_9GAMM|nr:phosphoribosylformylglycinamidine cyclo-ligase [Salinisphaera sp. P385]MDT0619390.1 phosphoribosylformylglycinamidine cyclo-ligase [Salinisphaera sp. P385]
MSDRPSLSYRDAGVDIDAGNALVDAIKPAVAATQRPEVIGGLGGFGGLFRVPIERYREPVLVSGTDGVGTKLRLAIEAGRFDGIGIDLVAMCVNDVLVAGAEPLFFLDYYATARLDAGIAAEVIRSIARGCEMSGMALIGGETAEMPGMYAPGDFDLAGFCVGVAEREAIIDGSGIAPGDVVLGLASSGAHSNGYSLIRKVLEVSGQRLDQPLGDATLADALLAPTRIYVAAVREVLTEHPLKGLAHITGGGLAENLARVLPAHCGARLRADSWPRPALFGWLQEAGGISDAEMQRTFNGGIGMAVVVNAGQAAAVRAAFEAAGETVFEIGEIVARDQQDDAVHLI